MKYRSRDDIIAMILNQARAGSTTKTRLMYGAYISYNQLKEYLAFLLDRSMLVYDGQAEGYMLTEKGMQFLRAYREIGEAVAPRSKVLSVAVGRTDFG